MFKLWQDKGFAFLVCVSTHYAQNVQYSFFFKVPKDNDAKNLTKGINE